MKLRISIGIDDVDSFNGGCSTHLATVVLTELERRYGHKVKLLDYPHLVRLNPSIPWKTRGNGAVAIHVELEGVGFDDLVSLVMDVVDRYTQAFRGPAQDPGVVLLPFEIVERIRDVYHRAVSDVVLYDVAIDVIRKACSDTELCYFEGGRGVVGALAAVSWIASASKSDYTFELLTYRDPTKHVPTRNIDEASVFEFDRLTKGRTFNNVDYESGKVLIAPHGPDPVLYGVRGEDAESVKLALSVIRTREPIHGWTVFRTNQGTDAHAVPRAINELKPFRTAQIWGVVASPPEVVSGGHVLVEVCDFSRCIPVAFFKPSNLASIARNLVEGDYVAVHGSAKPWTNSRLVLHADKLIIVRLASSYILEPPRCPRCGAAMESLGRAKGYRCRRCGFRSLIVSKSLRYIERSIKLGIFVPPPRAQKHLVKPLERYGREKHGYEPQPTEIRRVCAYYRPLDFL